MTEKEKYRSYLENFDKEQRFYVDQISDRDSKAFEYGTLVVKNAILISGGALLSIPAIVGLSSDINVDMESASTAGVCFALALLLSIAGAYVIHVNWTLHSGAWDKLWHDRAELLKRMYLEDSEISEEELQPKKHYSRWITLTFWVPHILVLFYLTSLVTGFFQLYGSLGIQ